VNEDEMDMFVAGAVVECYSLVPINEQEVRQLLLDTEDIDSFALVPYVSNINDEIYDHRTKSLEMPLVLKGSNRLSIPPLDHPVIPWKT
jgi:hypothetical protein